MTSIAPFQSTHPRGVRLSRYITKYITKSFQSTHPRGVRPAIGLPSNCTADISIHAPAWGATVLVILNRAPRLDFNPRTRVGCDHFIVIILSVLQKFQSTHPRGVRLAYEIPQAGLKVFQSTHPRGVRLSRYITKYITKSFQSTHPRGVRLLDAFADDLIDRYFNPRTRVGCDFSW